MAGIKYHNKGDGPLPHPYGPAMSKLTPLQQRFVEILIDQPMLPQVQCLVKAGYVASHVATLKQANRLMHKQEIIDARREASQVKLAAMAPLAIDSLEGILKDPNHRHHMRAIDSLLDRTGYAAVQKTESHTTVTHQLDREQIIASIASLLQRNQSALPSLPAPAAQVAVSAPVGAEFTEIDEDDEDDDEVDPSE